MKKVTFAMSTAKSLRKYQRDVPRIRAKLERYAQTGAGDAIQMVGSSQKRLRVGEFRVIFEESETDILVTKIGSRGSIYEE